MSSAALHTAWVQRLQEKQGSRCGAFCEIGRLADSGTAERTYPMLQRNNLCAEMDAMSVLVSDFASATRIIGSRTVGNTSRPTPPERKPENAADQSKASIRAAQAVEGKAAGRRSRRFTSHSFRFGDERYTYRLYVPDLTQADVPSEPLPLVVLLHGGQQDATDFAKGTGMNRLAQRHRCMVLYPEQLAGSNPMRCWNWFDRAHQSRGAGEPAMISALTRHVLEKRKGDRTRVYIAGLSAGGAMAVLVARLYPELFAAAGVHSGLAAGAARDLLSALSAMSHGASRNETGTAGPAVPTIVFHGSEDRTVHPANGEQVALAAVAGLDAAGLDLVKSDATHEDQGDRLLAPRRTQRTCYSAPDGISHVEHWAVHAGPHGWFGGHPDGSFTDPQGPGASSAMLSFFLQHRNRAAASMASGVTGAPG